jgi:hypothetical protein
MHAGLSKRVPRMACSEPSSWLHLILGGGSKFDVSVGWAESFAAAAGSCQLEVPVRGVGKGTHGNEEMMLRAAWVALLE